MPPAVDPFGESPGLPPMWGGSFWWTRAGGLLGLAALITGTILLSSTGKYIGPCSLPHQLTQPVLAIELARTYDDILKIAGPCEASHCAQGADDSACFQGRECQVFCTSKVDALVSAQYIDYALIIFYWLFFAYLAVISWRFCYWQRYGLFTSILGKSCGAVTIVTATLGALNDWRENQCILDALGQLHLISSVEPAMRYFAYVKWKMIFIAIGAAAPVFLFWTGRSNHTAVRGSAFSHVLAWITAALAISTTWTGVLATVFGDDQRLEVAASRLGLVLISATLTLATAQYWRGGTVAALDRFARLPGLSFLANLFFDEDNPPKAPNADLNLLP